MHLKPYVTVKYLPVWNVVFFFVIIMKCNKTSSYIDLLLSHQIKIVISGNSIIFIFITKYFVSLGILSLPNSAGINLGINNE